MIFGMCNIWVILWLTFSQSKFPDMMSSDGILYSKKRNLICNSSYDVISGHFDSEKKVDQDEVFCYKYILHFFSG